MGGHDCVPSLRAAGLDFMADWADARPVRMGGRGCTCRDIWDASPRGDWLLDYAQDAGAPWPAIVRAAAACVRPALRFVPEGEDRPRLAVEAAEAWVDKPTERNRRRAAKAAKAAKAGAAALVAEGAAEEVEEAVMDAGAWVAVAASRHVAWSMKQGAVAWAAWSGAGWASKAAEAARHAAWAHGYAEGPESRVAADAACADEVRRIVPFRDLAARR